MIVNIDAAFIAYITVTYLSGTCTLSLGSTSYSHSGGGTYTFAVRCKGTWTLTNTVGTNSESHTVEITARAQRESISINLGKSTYFYKRGTQTVPWSWGGSEGATGPTDGPAESTGQYGLVSFGTNSARFHFSERFTAVAGVATAYTTSKVDLTNIKTLYVVTSGGTGNSTYTDKFGIGTISDPASLVMPGTIVKSTLITKSDSETVTELDVSAVSGSHQIFIQHAQYYTFFPDLYVYEVYGE